MELTNKIALCAVSLLMVAAGLFVVTSAEESNADSVTVDGIEYTLSGSNATVVGISADMPSTDVFNIPPYIITGNNQYDVVSIADFAFMNCSVLTDTINIPKSISSIGKGCFMGSNLKHIIVENGSGFRVVSDVLYKDSVLIAGAPKISGTVTIQEGTKKVNSYAFFNCTGITELIVPTKTPIFGERCFEGCWNMRWTPTLSFQIGTTPQIVVDKYAFKDCYGLNGQLTMDSSMLSLPIYAEGAFYNCIGLTSLQTFVDSFTLEPYCFHGCENMLSIAIEPTSRSAFHLKIASSAFDSHTFYNDKDEIITVSGSTLANHVFTGEAPSHMTYRLYTVHFDPNGGIPDKSDEQFNRGYKYTIPTDYVVYRDGYQFLGWNLNGVTYNPGSKITVIGDMNFIAVWKQIVYHDVIFNLNGGTGNIPSMSVMEEEDFTLPSYSGTKTGYNFGGWSYNGNTYQPGNKLTMGYSNMTFTAVWNQTITHNVKFDLNGGTGTVSPMSVAEGSSFTLPLYSGTKTGYTFDGWQYNGTTYKPGTSMTMGSFDMTFTASWKQSGTTYTVTFDPNGGFCSTKTLQTDFDHKLPNLPNATRDGYKFEGWTYNGSTITLNTQFNKDCTVHAQWSSETIIPGVDDFILYIGIIVLVLVLIGAVVFFRNR